MFKNYIFAFKVTLSDYLTMAEFLASKDIDKGFVAYNTHTLLVWVSYSTKTAI